MRKKEKGASAVEFAIVMPVLVLLLFGIIEFSILMYDKAVLTNACREGARTGILMGSPRPSVADIQTIVTHYCQNNLVSFSNTPPAWTTTVPATCGSAGEIITVSVAYPYTFLFLPDFVAHTVTLTASSAMRCE